MMDLELLETLAAIEERGDRLIILFGQMQKERLSDLLPDLRAMQEQQERLLGMLEQFRSVEEK